MKKGAFSYDNRTEWSPIRSVIIRVITRSDDRTLREFDLSITKTRLEVLLPINHKNYNFREKSSQVMKEREPRLRLVAINYNFESDWLMELSDNKLSDDKLSDNNLASELV